MRFSQNDSTSLRQNQRLSARVIIEQKDNVLRIKRGDFVASGGGRTGYLVEDGLATKDPLPLGALLCNGVELLDGAKEGDQLVISSLSDV